MAAFFRVLWSIRETDEFTSWRLVACAFATPAMTPIRSVMPATWVAISSSESPVALTTSSLDLRINALSLSLRPPRR